jgi:uncharacterized protein YjiS (DUF1127 family)
MSMSHRTAEYVETAELAPHVPAFIRRCWHALQQRRKRTRLRAALYALPERNLRDIGISFSEIEYLALYGADEREDPRRRP